MLLFLWHYQHSHSAEDFLCEYSYQQYPERYLGRALVSCVAIKLTIDITPVNASDHIPKIIRPRPPHPLQRSLHNLHPKHIRTIYFHPQLRTHPRQLIPQQNTAVHAPPPDIHAYARERVAGAKAHEQDVADFGGIGVCAGEKASAGGGGVEGEELGGLEGEEGGRAVGAGGG